MQDRYFSDEELVAYLDGEGDFAPMDEIALALKTDVALAKRLEALRIDTSAIADSFAGLADVSADTLVLPEKPVKNAPYHQFAAVAVVMIMLGFGIGYSTFGVNRADWKDYVAAYQALYTTSTMALAERDEALEQTELNKVAAAIGKEINIKDLKVAPEIDYRRAQILGYQGKALAQIAFLSSTGQPIALCIIRSDKTARTEIRSADMEDMSAAYWTENGYDYLLIGGTDQPLINRLASAFKDAVS